LLSIVDLKRTEARPAKRKSRAENQLEPADDDQAPPVGGVKTACGGQLQAPSIQVLRVGSDVTSQEDTALKRSSSQGMSTLIKEAAEYLDSVTGVKGSLGVSGFLVRRAVHSY